jgi:hypothetical protein
MHPDQLIPEQRVLLAVVNTAVFDTCRQPIYTGEPTVPIKRREYRLDSEARTAFQFIWGEGLEIYCRWLPLEPSWLRNKLLVFMYDPKPRKSISKNVVLRIDDTQRRYFRLNYKLYKLEKEPCWTSPEEESHPLPIKQVTSRLDPSGRVLDRSMSGRPPSGTRKSQKTNSGSNAFTSMSQYLNGIGTVVGQEPSEESSS